jgi:hypothetical protein
MAISNTTTSIIFQVKKPSTVVAGVARPEPIFLDKNEPSGEEDVEVEEDKEDSLSRIWLNVDII